MITKKELWDFARIKDLNIGNAEKDYLIDIALSSIFQHTKNELVFKGGTCLYKFHKLNRLSEDIDFSAVKDIEISRLINRVLLDFERYGIKVVQHQRKEPYNSVLITLRIEGPLFNGKSITYANLGIDINLKSPAVLEPELLNYNSIYPEIPAIHALCMRLQEIFAEKIRAILTRIKARDLFDLNFLLDKGVYASAETLNEKMEYYEEVFNIEKLLSRLKLFEQYWKKELLGFTRDLQDFNSVMKNVKGRLMDLYKK